MDLGLKGKVAMVAGASRGLGFAVAQALANEGALVSIASRDEASICAAAERLGSKQVLATPLDVKSADGILRWTRATEDRFGGVDLLFANGGGPPAGAALSFDDAAWQGAVDLLLFSSLRMVRATVPSMIARGGGAILMSTSSSVKEPIQNLGLSTVLRASVSALAKTLALELAASGIRVGQSARGSRLRTRGMRTAARRASDTECATPMRRTPTSDTAATARPVTARSGRSDPASAASMIPNTSAPIPDAGQHIAGRSMIASSRFGGVGREPQRSRGR